MFFVLHLVTSPYAKTPPPETHRSADHRHSLCRLPFDMWRILLLLMLPQQVYIVHAAPSLPPSSVRNSLSFTRMLRVRRFVIIGAPIKNQKIVSVKLLSLMLLFLRHWLPIVFHMSIPKWCTVTRNIIPKVKASSTMHILTTMVNHGLTMLLSAGKMIEGGTVLHPSLFHAFIDLEHVLPRCSIASLKTRRSSHKTWILRNH